jgi:hypothetical protein
LFLFLIVLWLLPLAFASGFCARVKGRAKGQSKKPEQKKVYFIFFFPTSN